MPVSPVIKGVATILWGTASLNTSPSGAVVVSGKITPKNGAPIEIEDGNGFAISEIFLDDGFDAALDFLYDSAKVWPNSAATVALTIPNTLGNGASTSYNTYVACEPSVDLGRKKETMISYKFTYRPQVNT